jgi:hypothetical protein
LIHLLSHLGQSHDNIRIKLLCLQRHTLEFACLLLLEPGNNILDSLRGLRRVIPQILFVHVALLRLLLDRNEKVGEGNHVVCDQLNG